MKQFDTIFIGTGVTGPSVFSHFIRHAFNKNGFLLIGEESELCGATFKGVKTQNQIFLKHPNIDKRQTERYKEFSLHVKASEQRLELLYNRTHPYLGKSNVGLRCCRTKEEYETLCTIQNKLDENNDLIIQAAKFIENNIGHNIDESLLFPYSERVWNINTYLRIIRSTITNDSILVVKKIKYHSSSTTGVFMEITNIDGSVEKIWASRVVVCRGIGNIEFERSIMQAEFSGSEKLDIGVIDFHKTIYRPKAIIPDKLTSIFIPEQGICITNEQEEEHSILYDTNAKLLTLNQYSLSDTQAELKLKRHALESAFPLLSKQYYTDFMCSMTMNLKAFSSDPSKHFQFTISQSMAKNITYINLPYFTVIGTALSYLPKNINDLI